MAYYKNNCPFKIHFGSEKNQSVIVLVILYYFLVFFYEVSKQPSLLQAEQPQLTQSVLAGKVVQSSYECHGLLDLLQPFHILMLGTPELEAALWERSQKSRVKGQNPLPCCAGHTAFNAAQGSLRSCGGFHQPSHPSPPLQGCCQSPLQPACRCVWDCRDPGESLAPGLAGFHEVHSDPLLKLVKAPLNPWIAQPFPAAC